MAKVIWILVTLAAIVLIFVYEKQIVWACRWLHAWVLKVWNKCKNCVKNWKK